MGLAELSLFPLLTIALLRLARAGRGTQPPGWTEVFPVAMVAWVIGAQGLVFRRQPDYMLAFLFEARGRSSQAYFAWAFAGTVLAFGTQALVLRANRRGRAGHVFLGLGLACAMLGAPLWQRATYVGSTFEARQDLLRPLSAQPAVRSLVILSLMASFLPVVIAALAVAADGVRQARRAAAGQRPTAF